MDEPIFELPGSQLQQIASYLATRPYCEVAGLMQQIASLKAKPKGGGGATPKDPVAPGGKPKTKDA